MSANGFLSWDFSTPFLDYTVKLDLTVLEHKIKTVKKIVYACLVPLNGLFILLTGTSFVFQWLALRFPKAAIYLDSLRECYEAYVIYNFMTFLLAYLSSEYAFEVVLSDKPQVKHFFPCCTLPPWRMGKYGVT